MKEMFIGITTWNDAAFIRRAIPALERTLTDVSYTIAAWDNGSDDDTCAELHKFGVEIHAAPCHQGDALCGLFALSQARYSLLLHSDVIMLAPGWLTCLTSAMQRAGAALISPEDIGFGNMLRSEIGGGMPESSFMFFETEKLQRCCRVHLSRYWREFRKRRAVNPWRRLPLYGDHITHDLPAVLHAHDLSWLKMTPVTSRKQATTWFDHNTEVAHRDWPADAPYYDYGYGNFYRFEGMITHYHNWYARIIGTADGDGYDPADFREVRRRYCEEATHRFFTDYDAGKVRLPE